MRKLLTVGAAAAMALAMGPMANAVTFNVSSDTTVSSDFSFDENSTWNGGVVTINDGVTLTQSAGTFEIDGGKRNMFGEKSGSGGTFTIANGATTNINDKRMENEGNLTVNVDGTLAFTGADNSESGIRAVSGGNLILRNNAGGHIVNNSAASSGGFGIDGKTSFVSVGDVTVEAGGNLKIDPSGDADVGNGVVRNSIDGGNWTVDGTVQFNGGIWDKLVFDASGAGNVVVNDTLTFSAGAELGVSGIGMRYQTGRINFDTSGSNTFTQSGILTIQRDTKIESRNESGNTSGGPIAWSNTGHTILRGDGFEFQHDLGVDVTNTGIWEFDGSRDTSSSRDYVEDRLQGSTFVNDGGIVRKTGHLIGRMQGGGTFNFIDGSIEILQGEQEFNATNQINGAAISSNTTLTAGNWIIMDSDAAGSGQTSTLDIETGSGSFVFDTIGAGASVHLSGDASFEDDGRDLARFHTVNGTLLVSNGHTFTPDGGTLTVNGILGGDGGTIDGTVVIAAGGVHAPGMSVGESIAANEQWNTGGKLEVEIQDLSLTAGNGWDLLTVTDTLELLGGPFDIEMVSLDLVGDPGALGAFDPLNPYDLLIVDAASLGTGFDLNNLNLLQADFNTANDPAGGSWGLRLGSASNNEDENDIYLSFTPDTGAPPVPEPATGLLALLAATGLGLRRRR